MDTELFKTKFDAIMNKTNVIKTERKTKNRVCGILLAAAVLGIVLSILVIKGGLKAAFIAGFLLLGVIAFLILRKSLESIQEAEAAMKPEFSEKVFLPMLNTALGSTPCAEPSPRMKELMDAFVDLKFEEPLFRPYIVTGERRGKRYEAVTGIRTAVREKKDEIIYEEMPIGTYVMISDPASHDATVLMSRFRKGIFLPNEFCTMSKVKLDSKKNPYTVYCEDTNAAFRFLPPVKLEKMISLDKTDQVDWMLAEKDSFFGHTDLSVILPEYCDPLNKDPKANASKLTFDILKTEAENEAESLTALIDKMIDMSARPML